MEKEAKYAAEERIFRVYLPSAKKELYEKYRFTPWNASSIIKGRARRFRRELPRKRTEKKC